MNGDFSIGNILKEEHRPDDRILIKYAGQQSALEHLSTSKHDQCSISLTQCLPSGEKNNSRPIVFKGDNNNSSNSAEYEIEHSSTSKNGNVGTKKSDRKCRNPYPTMLSKNQISILEEAFQEDPYPRTVTISTLANSTGLSKARIKVRPVIFHLVFN